MVAILSRSEPGRSRYNEDAFQVAPHPQSNDGYICIVADGQGGQLGGQRASVVACQTTMEIATSTSSQELAKGTGWSKILTRADQAVKDDRDAGFTTLVAAYIHGNIVYGASSGDSAALITTASGEPRWLTDQQQKNPPVGAGNARFVPFSASLTVPWTFAQMTDGVWKYIGREDVATIVQQNTGQAIVDTLYLQARRQGYGRLQDDFTIVVIESNGDEEI